MAADHGRPLVPPKQLKTDYPLIDSDPHIRRVFGYARPTDYAWGLGAAVGSPLIFVIQDRLHPASVGRVNYNRALRLVVGIGMIGGLAIVNQKSSNRFYGFTENVREEEMDMREMVDKAKRGEPLYGVSQLSPYMQGVAARNSRYSSLNIHKIPWPNVVNHNQHGVDTAKYYRQAERELEAERGNASRMSYQ